MTLPRKKDIRDINRAFLNEPLLTSVQWDVFVKGIELFNRRQFWEAHEAWEAVWREREEESRIFFQGIIQAAAGYHLLHKRRFIGACNNFDKAFRKLELFSGSFLGINVDRLRKMIEKTKMEMSRLCEQRLDEFPSRLIPTLEIRPPDG